MIILPNRGFFEDYQKNKQSGTQQRPIIRNNIGTAITGFLGKLMTAVLYLTATALSSVGLTTLINKPLRDMLFELVRKLFSSG